MLCKIIHAYPFSTKMSHPRSWGAKHFSTAGPQACPDLAQRVPSKGGWAFCWNLLKWVWEGTPQTCYFSISTWVKPSNSLIDLWCLNSLVSPPNMIWAFTLVKGDISFGYMCLNFNVPTVISKFSVALWIVQKVERMTKQTKQHFHQKFPNSLSDDTNPGNISQTPFWGEV